MMPRRQHPLNGWLHPLLAGLMLLLTVAAQADETAPTSHADAEASKWDRWAAVLREDGPTLRPLLPRQTLFSVSSHATPETSLLLIETLADRNVLEQVGIERETVVQLLAGLKLVAPIIEDQIHPEIQIVIARQTFDDPAVPQPEIKLPAVALVFRPRDVHQVRRTLLSAYWAAMIEAHETALKQGRPGLRMESARRGEGFYAASTFRDPPDDRPDLQGLAEYNFSSAIGIAGERMILASSRELVIELVDLANAEPQGKILVDEKVRIDVAPIMGLRWAVDNQMAVLSQTGLSTDVVSWIEKPDAWTRSLLKRLPSPRLTLRYRPLSRYWRDSSL